MRQRERKREKCVCVCVCVGVTVWVMRAGGREITKRKGETNRERKEWHENEKNSRDTTKQGLRESEEMRRRVHTSGPSAETMALIERARAT